MGLSRFESWPRTRSHFLFIEYGEIPLFTSTAAVLVALALTGTCSPSDAWTETIVVTPAVDAVAAVGTPTVTVPNPDFIPGVPGIPEVAEVSHIVTHPAVGEPTIQVANPAYIPPVHHDGTPDTVIHHEAVIVHHAAVTHTEWRYSQHGGNGFIWVGNDDHKYVDDAGNGFDKKPKHGTFYERSQKTRTVTDCDAWDETITEAWDEVVPGTPAWDDPAVGEPMLEQPNPDYVAAWDETVVDVPFQPAVPAIPSVGEPTLTITNPDFRPAVDAVPAVTRLEDHPAVVCPVVKPETKPAVQPQALAPAYQVKPEQVGLTAPYQDAELAETGGDFNYGWLVAGGSMLLLGAGAYAFSLRPRRH